MTDFSAQLLAFDTETTGVDVTKDRVVQLGAAYFERRVVVAKHQMLVDPGIPIPSGASAIHGIFDAHVQGKAKFATVGARFAEHLAGTVRGGRTPVLVGYNAISYDVPLLNAEFARHGLATRIDPEIVLDPMVFVSWHLRALRSRKLTDVSTHFGLSFEGAHTAQADAIAAGALLLKLVEQGHIPDDVDAAIRAQRDLRAKLADEWAEFMYWLYRDRTTGALRLGSGKNCGALVSETDPGYLDYFLKKVTDLPPRVREEFGRRAGRV